MFGVTPVPSLQKGWLLRASERAVANGGWCGMKVRKVWIFSKKHGQFTSVWHKVESFWKMEYQLRKCPTRLACGQACAVFSWLTWERPAYYGLMVLGSIKKKKKKGSYTSHGEETSQEETLLHSLYICSCFQVPALTSFNDEQKCRSVTWINPFLPCLLFGHGVSLDCGVLLWQYWPCFWELCWVLRAHWDGPFAILN